MKNQGLYDPSFEHDSCGVGFVADINGRASHDIVRDGLTILNNLVHRGAVGSDVNSGDGAGILTQIPWEFFGAPSAGIDFPLDNPGETGVGMLFMPKTPALYRKALALVEAGVLSRGGSLLGWRDVPVNSECLGPTALQSQPLIRQVFLRFPGLSGEALERMLYLVRRTWEKAAEAAGLYRDDFYPVSLSCRTIIYKGMFVAPQIPLFFPDLGDPLFTSALALVHQRYSTNTFPSWSLAQPFRHIAHNGEINTLQGNRTMMQAREKSLSSPLFGKSLPDLLPLIGEGLSDSAVFDAVFEFLHRGGRSLEHTMMMMVPEAFGAKYHISQDKRGFYEYHAAIMEPWDGPAALVFTDGVKIGASLDRNGLRPLRYTITEEGRIVLASETGVLDLPAETIVKQGRLGPGKILVVDLEARRIRFNNEVKSRVSRQRPYRRWLEENQVELKGFFRGYSPEEPREEGAPFLPDVFGYTLEDRDRILIPMAEEAQEPISSMGNDAALAVLSDRPQLLYTYFKQVFAQVTNPPIDPYRENLVMSLMSFIGREENILEEGPGHCRKLKLPHPVLTNEDMTLLRRAGEGFEGVPRSVTLGILYEAGGGAPALQAALKRLCAEAENHIREGASFLILSDRGVGPSLCPIPALLAVSAVHQHLIAAGIRHLSALLVESGEVREVMHFAALIGFGASAVNPYLAFQTVAELQGEGRLREGLSREDALDNYIIAVKKGLLKVMSKMGISTLRSYRGARIFEAVGLSESLVNAFFTGTPSRIGGIGLEAVAEAQERRHAKAFSGPKEPLESGGAIHFRKTGERHLMTPEAVVFLQEAVRQGDWDSYRRYAEEINDTSRGLCTLRGLFRFKPGQAVPLDEVEPVESLVKRFVSSAMSFGSISREAHETIAVAMNRLGGMSNSGEGGEDPERYKPLPGGDSRSSAVKQVASGRFGVTIGVPGERQGASDQDGPGGQTGRGGTVAGAQGQRRDCPCEALHPGGHPDYLPRLTTTSTPSKTWPS
jgi:glutamate synthase (NADPH) large chain